MNLFVECYTFRCHIVKAGFFIMRLYICTLMCKLYLTRCIFALLLLGRLAAVCCACFLHAIDKHLYSSTWMQPISLSVGRGALKPGAF